MRYGVTVAAIVLVTLIAGPVALGTEAAKIGIVDIMRVLDESKYKAEYEQRIKAMIQQKQDERKKLANEAEQRVETIKMEMLLLTEEAKIEKRKEIAAEVRKLKEFEVQAQKAIQEQGRDYMKELEEKVKAIVNEVAAEEGLELVLNSVAVIYNKEARDLTDVVLKKLDELFNNEHAETDSDGSD